MAQRKSKNAANENINPQAEALADLPLTDEQAEDSKAGAERFQEYLKIELTDVFIS